MPGHPENTAFGLVIKVVWGINRMSDFFFKETDSIMENRFLLAN